MLSSCLRHAASLAWSVAGNLCLSPNNRLNSSYLALFSSDILSSGMPVARSCPSLAGNNPYSVSSSAYASALALLPSIGLS
jgi:hypothetical protein